jgi:hypothetical protein
MALKLHFASLSLGASVDQQTGHLSVFDLVEEIRAPQLPIHIQSLVISLSLEKTVPQAATGKMFIHVIAPGAQPALVGSGDMAVPAEQKRMKAVFRFGGFPIQAFGSHRFVLSWVNPQGVKEGEALLDFDVIQMAQVAQGIPPSEKPPISH